MSIASELVEAMGGLESANLKRWKVTKAGGIKSFDFPGNLNLPMLKKNPALMKKGGMTIKYKNLVITDSQYGTHGSGYKAAVKLAKAHQAKADIDVDVPREELGFFPAPQDDPVEHGFYTWQSR